jgi:hypothetical protein
VPADDLEARLLRRVMHAQLPPEEAISKWIAEPSGEMPTSVSMTMPS